MPKRSRRLHSARLGSRKDATKVSQQHKHLPEAGNAAAAIAGAEGHGHNDFKIELGKRTLRRALQQASELEI